MATQLLPYDEWVAGTLQNSVPANTNALRSEALAANVISDALTAQPGSPADGDCYIIPAGATGTQWATFAEGSLAYYRAGTWYEFTAYEGLLKVVAGEIKIYNGSAWEVYAGGGGGGGSLALTVQESGVDVDTDTTTINFTGSGVSVTQTAPGVVEVDISGGGGGGAAPAIAWEGYATINPDTATSSVYGITAPNVTSGGSSAKTIASTSKLAALPRRSHNATASTSALGGVRGSNGLVFFVASANCGGCEVEMIVSPGLGATVSSHRFFGGWLSNNNAPSDVNPSTLTNIVGVGYDSADTNLQFMHNDGSGTATKVDLGSGLPKPTVAEAAAYYIKITSNTPGQVDYFVENIITGNTASGSVSTNLPTVGLNWHSWQSAGGTSTAIEHIWSYAKVKVFA